MRVYFEKPRTTVGWKGLINDPRLDGSFAVNEGLRMARRLLLDLVNLGLPAGCEFLDPITPQFTSDLVAWGAIGARTTESQVHRELASGLSAPIGFKNGTDGNIRSAIDAIQAAARLPCTLMVDCSHANSGKLHSRQVEVARDVAAQLEAGARCVFGVMIESHLQAGAQKFAAGKDDPAQLAYGQSITDACLGWDDSVRVLETLSEAVARRRVGEAVLA